MDKIYVGIASINGRQKYLKKTIESLINQCDKMYICLNNYMRIPSFCYHEKIFAFLYDNEKGDAGKYFAVDKLEGYYFSCDDDLIYPKNYISIYIRHIDKYSCLITTHGRIMMKKPIKSYYQGHLLSINCLGENRKIIDVDIPGSGVSGFHTKDLKLKYSHFKAANMADIWLAKQCKLQNIKCKVIEFKKNWLIYQNPEYIGSIHALHKHNDEIQTKIVNSI